MNTIKTFMPLLLVVLVAFVLLSDKAQGFLSSIFASRAVVDEEKDIKGATISKTEAQGVASKLYGAMAGVGTDGDNLMLAFQRIENEQDFNLVYNVFGKRQYSKFWGNDGDMASSDRLDLIEWLTHDLSNDRKLKEELSITHPYLVL